MYYIYLVKPKVKNYEFVEPFIMSSHNNNNPKRALENRIKHAKTHNKLSGRLYMIEQNGGIQTFEILLLEKIECKTDELSFHKDFYNNAIKNYCHIDELIKKNNN